MAVLVMSTLTKSCFLLRIALLACASILAFRAQTEPVPLEDEAADLFLERHIINGELEPFLRRESQIKANLSKLTQQESQIRNDLHGLQEKQGMLESQAQTVVQQLVDVRTQLNASRDQLGQLQAQAQAVLAQQKENNAKIAQFAEELAPLLDQLSNARVTAGFACGEIRCQECGFRECPDDCQSACANLQQIQAEIEAKKPEAEQLAATRDLLAAEQESIREVTEETVTRIDQLQDMQSTLQSEQESLSQELGMTVAQEELEKGALADNTAQQEAALKDLAENAEASQPIRNNLAKNAQKFSALWGELKSRLDENFDEFAKTICKIWVNLRELEDNIKLPVPGVPPGAAPAILSITGLKLLPEALPIPPLAEAEFWALVSAEAIDLGIDFALNLCEHGLPRIDFTGVSRPEPANFSVPQELQTLPDNTKDAVIENLQAGGGTIAYLNAANSSLQRYDGAVAAGDSVWAQHQKAAVLTYLRGVQFRLPARTDSLEIIRKFLEDNPEVNLIATPEASARFFADVRGKGLPEVEVNLLQEMGLSSSQIEEIRQSLLLLEGSNLGGARVSDLLEVQIEFERGLVETLQQVIPPNRSPACVVGGPYVAECQGPVTSVILDGTASSDPDGDVLTPTWTTDCPFAHFDDPTSLKTTLSVPSTVVPVNCHVTLTITDLGGLSASCTTSLTIVDSTSPALSCPSPVILAADENCQAVVPDFLGGLTVSDNCTETSALTLTQVPTAGIPIRLGTTTVIVTAADESGNTNSCATTVTVKDTTPPTIICPGDVSVKPEPGNCSTVVNFEVTVSDNCPGATVACDPPSGSHFPGGTTAVVCRAMDLAGNESSCSFNVTVEDLEAPQITKLTAVPNILWPPNRKMVPVKLDVATMDNCGVVSSRIISVSRNDAAQDVGNVREPKWELTGNLSLNLWAERSPTAKERIYTVLVACSDAAGNTATKSVVVTVPHDKRDK